MIKAIHIEDEPGIVALVENLVTRFCSDKVSLVGNAPTISEGIELIRNQQPQLVYLDIELNQGSAFDLLYQVEQTIGINFSIIFITAFNEYAIKAFRKNAVDYILKPISTTELIEATDRAIARINTNVDAQHIVNMIRSIELSSSANSKIGLPINQGLHFINIVDIVKVEANGSYAKIYLVNNTSILSSKSLKEIEILLPPSIFIRIHHAWTVNKNHLRKYFRGKNSYMEMDDGSTVPVSHRRKSEFLDIFSLIP